MIKITYFVHGTTIDNEKKISSGWKNAELSKKGLQQSISLKENVKNIKFDAVFSSDLKRAVDSAKLTFGNNIILDKRLRECNYGEFNGKESSIVEPMQEKCIDKKFPKGESYEDVKKRVADFLRFVEKKYQGKTIAIVSHKAPQLALDVLLRGKTWKESFSEDWRKKKAWQPGWEYIIKTL
ncbi:MAG: histidine phosphatase family protein [Candidatus Nanoarchaeia archaeon]|jgi:alpha-ribazole phosphatase/probable phosphoglycerate mutase